MNKNEYKRNKLDKKQKLKERQNKKKVLKKERNRYFSELEKDIAVLKNNFKN